MIQHFTLTAKVSGVANSAGTIYTLMAVCEERNEKWTSGPLTAAGYRSALKASRLSEEQIEDPIHSGKQVEFKTEDGKNMLFLEMELHKMGLHKITNG